MKNITRLFLILIAIISYLENVNAQPFSSTWALTTDNTPSISGNTTAGNATGGSGIGTIYYSSTYGIYANNFHSGAIDWTDYFQYTVSPTTNNNMSVSSISFYYSVNVDSMNLAVYYSLDNFNTSYQLGSDVLYFKNTSTNVQFTNSTTITVNSGQTLTIRVYGWKATQSSRNFRNKSFVISGTTSCVTPTITSITPVSGYGAGTYTLGATASAGTVNWYTSVSGGSSIATGTSYTASISATTVYYVDATSGSCTTSYRTPVTATVNPAITLSNGTGITVNGTCPNFTINSLWSASGNNIYNNNSGNIGIGTAKPLTNFHFKGVTDFSQNPPPGGNSAILRIQDSTINNSEGNRNAWWDFISSASNSRLLFSTGNANSTLDVMTLQENGNVGIGTSTPHQKLEIMHSEATGGIELNRTSVGTSFKSEIKFSKNNVEKWAIGNDFGNNGTQNFFIWDQPNNKAPFFIDEHSNIGINTITPFAKLDVAGKIRASDTIHSTSGGFRFPDNTVQSTATKNLIAGTGILISGDTIKNTIPDQTITLTGVGSTNVTGTYPNFTITSTDNNTSYSAGTGLSLNGTTFNSVWSIEGNNIFNNNTGKVGIGTNNPQTNLHLKGHTIGLANPRSAVFRIEDTLSYETGGGRNVYWDFTVSALQSKLYFTRTTGGITKDVLILGEDGRVGINAELSTDTNSLYKLCVGGGIMARDVRVTAQNFPDYVFAKDYKLMQLSELEKYISANNHLPNIPSAKDVISSGFEIGNMQQKLLEKVEEQTLYIINLQKQIDELKQLLNQNK